MRRAIAVVALAATMAGSPAVASAAPVADPTVTVAIHIVLEVPQALHPQPDSHCLGDRRPYAVRPIPDVLLRSYERQLRALGTVRDHFGFGTWMVGSTAASDLAFEGGDHVFVTTRLSAVKRFLPAFLHRMRRDLHQQETLAEIVGGAYPSLGEPRTRFDVVVPYARASYDPLRSLHRIFGDSGHSGATQYDDADGVHVSSSVARDAVGRIAQALRAAGVRPTLQPSTFVTDDAPRCAR